MDGPRQPAAQQVGERKLSSGAIIIDVVDGALRFAILGALFGYVFPHLFPQFSVFLPEEIVPWIELGWKLLPSGGFWSPIIACAAIGGIAGIMAGVVEEIKIQRDPGVARKSGQAGTQFLPFEDPQLRDKLERVFPESAFLTVQNAIQVHAEVGRIVVVDVSFSRGYESSETVTQTVAYLESNNVEFPKFTLHPSSFGLIRLFSTLAGIQSIDLPGHPEFSRAHYLGAVRVEDTRRLFTNNQLLDRLGRSQGLWIAAHSSSLVIYREGIRLETEEREGFVKEAAEIFRLLEESARKSALTAKTLLTAKVDVKVIAQNMPGHVGKLFREKLVTHADVDAFIHQPLPRRTPDNIRRNIENPALEVLWGGGVIASLIGTLFASAAYRTLADGERFMSDAGAVLVVGLVLLSVGSTVAYFARRSRIREKRLLSRGQECSARIQKIDAKDWSNDKQRTHRMTVQFQFEGRTMEASYDIWGDALERAEKYAADKKPARILCDPLDPRNILFVDALLNVSPEYEP